MVVPSGSRFLSVALKVSPCFSRISDPGTPPVVPPTGDPPAPKLEVEGADLEVVAGDAAGSPSSRGSTPIGVAAGAEEEPSGSQAGEPQQGAAGHLRAFLTS